MVDKSLEKRCEEVIHRITCLQQFDRYEGAFVFGSYVTSELHQQSDLDFVVLISEPESCSKVNHPRLNGIPVDISFNSFTNIQTHIQRTLS